MKRRTALVLLAVLVPAAFLAGWLASRGGGPGAGGRKALYYVDPMNPSFRSPEPGTAPCGMPLEPVYADGPAPASDGAAAPPGSVAVRTDRLQLIGVSREQVRSGTLRSTLRLIGSVAADETRLFRVTAATSGRIQEMGAATTGSFVGKGELLGAYYTTETLVPQQNFIRMYEAYHAIQMGGSNPYDHIEGGTQYATYARNVDVARELLLNLGMSPEQIEQIAASGQPAYLVQIRSPTAGLVTSRNVSFGQTFDEREDLFTIADIGRVWVLADAFEGQEEFFRAGTRAVVTQPGAGRRFAGVVSDVLPRFDPATRTLKVRLDVHNPGYLLRPDMLVDVELPVEIGPALFVPKEAVLDSGTRRVVFVEEGEGVFVPRAVRTGRRLGERVEIVGGLMEGETVVTSGNFLLDSESRMRAAGAAAAGTALDPVCGMEVEEAKARAKGLVSGHGGASWFFCSDACKRAFDRDPATAVAKAQGAMEPKAAAAPAAAVPSRKAFHMVDPVCGMDVDPDEAARTGLVSTFEGGRFSFCSRECKEAFDRNPSAALVRLPKATGKSGTGAEMPHEGGHGGTTAPMGMPGKALPAGQQPNQMPGMAPPAALQPHPMPGTASPAGDQSHQMPGMAPSGTMMGRGKPGKAKDPFCQEEVDVEQARAAGLFSEFNGVTWYFDSEACKQGFEGDPKSYIPLVREPPYIPWGR